MVFEPVEDVELREGDAVEAGDPDRLLATTASNQPTRRGRPVTVPNSFPRVADPFADLVVELGREGAGADARRVGLHDADDGAERGRRNPEARAGAARRARGGRHEGIRPVVHVEHDALGALAEELLAGRELRVQPALVSVTKRASFRPHSTYVSSVSSTGATPTP